jgi:hypothetical protein
MQDGECQQSIAGAALELELVGTTNDDEAPLQHEDNTHHFWGLEEFLETTKPKSWIAMDPMNSFLVACGFENMLGVANVGHCTGRHEPAFAN